MSAPESPAQAGARLTASAHPDDVALTHLERAVASGMLTVNGAITRAYMLGREAEREEVRGGGSGYTGTAPVGGGGSGGASVAYASGVQGACGGGAQRVAPCVVCRCVWVNDGSMCAYCRAAGQR